MQVALGLGGAGISRLSGRSLGIPASRPLATRLKTRATPFNRIILPNFCLPALASVVGATVALVVTLSRRLLPAYHLHRFLVIQLVTSANAAHFRTFIFAERLKGTLPGAPDPPAVALTYSDYLAAVVELERNLHICHLFLSPDVYRELLERLTSVKSLLSEDGYPCFDLVDQMQLGLNRADYLMTSAEYLMNSSGTIGEPRNLLEALIQNLENCTESSSCAKLRELDNLFVGIIQLLDPEERYSCKDVTAFIPDENYNFPARRRPSKSGFFIKVVRAILEAGAGAVQLAKAKWVLNM